VSNTSTLGIRFDSVESLAVAHNTAAVQALPVGTRILAPYPEQSRRGDILTRRKDGLWHREVFAPIHSTALTAFPVRILTLD
jgi:hypothetical protein